MSNQLKEMFRLMGKLQAQALKERGAAMNGTALIDAELFIPAWKPGPYSTVGQPVREGGQVYKVLQAHDSSANPGWSPAASPALFEIMHTTDPAKAKPYVQSLGLSGAYDKGEVCLWNGKAYRSKVDNNAYSPGAYAQNWELVG